MAYSELIKSFSKIREYMSQFYVYGFKSRNEYHSKSARSYDNERRRMESWLGDYMFFRRNVNGKNTFISVDSQTVSHNPLYNAFKAKSFTANDITFHFYIMDILADGAFRSIKEIMDIISNDYLSMFSNPREPDESTIRKKLKEYERLGLLESKKHGKELVFRRAQDKVHLESWQDAVNFYSEEDSLGVVGSYILDKYNQTCDCFSFKHHYILHALESEILHSLFIAIRAHKAVELKVYSSKKASETQHLVLPLKIYISTQGGRRYLMAYQYGLKRIAFYRLDSIRKIALKECEPDYSKYYDIAQRFKNRLWGVSVGKGYRLEHIEMTVFVGEGEEYIINRLEREKRCGITEKIDERHYKFSADVYDAMELMPWIRTFIGRITKLESSNDEVVGIFYSDLAKMKSLYGGDGDAVQ